MPVKVPENFEQSKNMSKIHSFFKKLASRPRTIELLFKDILGYRHYCYIKCFTMMCHFHILIDDQRKPINFKGETIHEMGKAKT